MEITGLTWGITIAVILGLILFDYYFHVRKAHIPTLKEAAVCQQFMLASPWYSV